VDNLKPTKKNDREYYLFALRIVGDFGVNIAVPVIVFALIGQALDEKYQTRPWFLILGFTIAAVLSGIIIYRKAKRYGEEYKKM
jgi:F0F1-type ATP synthase assembly protein I